MANRYTYDDFQKAMQSSGLGGQFSDADLKLAQKNPDAGMSILKYKQDYKKRRHGRGTGAGQPRRGGHPLQLRRVHRRAEGCKLLP